MTGTTVEVAVSSLRCSSGTRDCSFVKANVSLVGLYRLLPQGRSHLDPERRTDSKLVDVDDRAPLAVVVKVPHSDLSEVSVMVLVLRGARCRVSTLPSLDSTSFPPASHASGPNPSRAPPSTPA